MVLRGIILHIESGEIKRNLGIFNNGIDCNDLVCDCICRSTFKTQLKKNKDRVKRERSFGILLAPKNATLPNEK